MRLNCLFTIFLFTSVLALNAQDIIQIGDNEVYDFCFSPAGTMAYISNGNDINIWDLQKKCIIGNLENGHNGNIISIDMSEDSLFLISSSVDSLISIWNLSNNTLIKRTKISSVANKVLFDNSGHVAVAGLRNGEILILNISSGEILYCKSTGLPEVTSIAISEKMEFLAISGSDGTIQLMNKADYIIYDQNKVHQGLVRGLAFSNDGKQIFSCGDDGKVYCYTTDNNKLDKASNVYKSSLFNPWVTAIDIGVVPQDIWTTQMIAYTTIRGDVYMETDKLQYYYPIKGEIFRVHFLPRQGYEFIIGLGTDHGLKLLYKKEAIFFQNPGAKGKMK